MKRFAAEAGALHVDIDVVVECAEGIQLATDVYRPRQPAPVVLRRTPFNRRTTVDEAVIWASLGYAFVVQDVRGRGDSSGSWQPFVHESSDGRATLAWLAQQPWCDGRIVAQGWSYEGFAALALPHHPCLKARVVAFPMPEQSAMEHGNGASPAFRLERAFWWWLTHGTGRTSRPGLYEALVAADGSWLAHAPPEVLAEHLGLPRAQEHLACGGQRALPQCDEPLLVITGWYDGYSDWAMELWQNAAAGSTLLAGPWTCDANQPLRAECARTFGPQADLLLGDEQVRWLDACLNAGPSDRKFARLFLLGSNRWIERDAWAHDALADTRIPLGADGQLGTSRVGVRRFRADPDQPVPALRSSENLANQLPRPDSLLFVSPPLAQRLAWIGRPEIHLWCWSDRPSVDWIAHLAYEDDAGAVFLLGEGIVEDQAEPYAGHQVIIRLAPMAVELAPGYRLLLQVAGSAFPTYAVNPHTGGDRLAASDGVVAFQFVECGGDKSVVVLPLMGDA